MVDSCGGVRAKCRDCPLAGAGGTFAFLLRPEHAHVVESFSPLRGYSAGSIIVAQGEWTEGWHVLRQGSARIYMSDSEGREHTVRFARPGDLIAGCAGNALGNPHGACYTAVALADGTEVCHFPVISQHDLFERCPDLAEAFLDLMAAHLADSYRRLHDLATTTARDRLIDALARLAEAHMPPAAPRAPGTETGPVTIRLARQQLADILGVAKETAVRALTSLKEQGLIKTQGQAIIIPDLEALKGRQAGRS